MNEEQSDSSPETTTAAELKTNFSPTRKRILFVSMCIVMFEIVAIPSMPYSYLPLYDEDRDISSSWTGLILGAHLIGWTVCGLAIAPAAMEKFSTRMLLSGSFLCNGILILLYSTVDLVKNVTAYIILSIAIRLASGVFNSIIVATIFVANVALYPQYVGTVLAVGELVINGALAFAPFFGGVLFEARGFIFATVIPGVLTLICIIPVIFLPNLCRKTMVSDDEKFSWKSILDPWVLFPLWHIASGQILLTYHIPLLSPHAEEAFHADVIWSGVALLIGKAPLVISSLLVGLLIDKFRVGPCEIMIASGLSLPVVYIFVGPLPLLSFVTPSKMQVILSLVFLGVAVPMSSIPAVPVMFQVYRSRNQGKLPAVVSNWLVSLYNAAFPLGVFIGLTVSGVIAPHASFGWSTGTLGLMYIAQSLLCVAYCVKVMRSKKTEENHSGDGTVLENPAADPRCNDIGKALSRD